MDKQPAIYILASKRNGTLYIGVTSDLKKKVVGTPRGIRRRVHKEIQRAHPRLLRAL